jgi:shikimate dehydrogenase
MSSARMQFLGVLGHPISQSKSPLMHNAAFKELHLPYAYSAFEIPPERLKEAVQSLRLLQFRGVNVTIPHKVAIMEYLDEISEEARHIGAVNTVVNENGRWIGYNTDGIGYIRSLKEETGIQLQGKKVLVIGAGGAARAIVYSLLKEHVGKCVIANRTIDRAEELANSLSAVGPVSAVRLEEVTEQAAEFDLMVNTTSVGMVPSVDESPLPHQVLDYAKKNAIISDLIYNPRETLWLREASNRGIQAHGGLGMFIYQGAYAFEYWTGVSAPTEVMRKALDLS